MMEAGDIQRLLDTGAIRIGLSYGKDKNGRILFYEYSFIPGTAPVDPNRLGGRTPNGELNGTDQAS